MTSLRGLQLRVGLRRGLRCHDGQQVLLKATVLYLTHLCHCHFGVLSHVQVSVACMTLVPMDGWQTPTMATYDRPTASASQRGPFSSRPAADGGRRRSPPAVLFFVHDFPSALIFLMNAWGATMQKSASHSGVDGVCAATPPASGTCPRISLSPPSRSTYRLLPSPVPRGVRGTLAESAGGLVVVSVRACLSIRDGRRFEEMIRAVRAAG